MVAAWIAKGLPGWHRAYFAGLGALFLFLGYDELSWLHEQNEAAYRLLYTTLGALVVAATLYIIRRYRLRGAGWHLLFTAGFGIMALGGMGVDQLGYRGLSLFLPELEIYHAMALEEMLELFGAWVVLLATLGNLDANKPPSDATARRLLNALSALTAVLLLALVLRNPYLRSYASELWRDLGNSVEFALRAEKKSASYEGGVTLAAFHLRQSARGLGFAPILTSDSPDAFTRLGYSLHLVDQATGDSMASVDTYLNRESAWRWLPGDEQLPESHIDETWAEIAYAPDMPRNRALWLVLTLWRDDANAYIRQQIRSSELALLDDTQAIVDEFALPAAAIDAPDRPPLARFENGFILQAADIPDIASVGESLSIRFHWRSETADKGEYIQFLHLRHEDSGFKWGHDQPPLGARLPTRLWREGLYDSETWHAPLPADLPQGSYALYTGLYRADNNERLAVHDASDAPLVDHILPLGGLTLE